MLGRTLSLLALVVRSSHEACSPADAAVNASVYFIKTHATGSSTVAGILHRYAVRHAATVLVSGSTSTVTFDDRSTREKFSAAVAPPRGTAARRPRAAGQPWVWSGRERNAAANAPWIFTGHSVSHPFIAGLLGARAAPSALVVVTILREPGRRLLSAFRKQEPGLSAREVVERALNPARAALERQTSSRFKPNYLSPAMKARITGGGGGSSGRAGARAGAHGRQLTLGMRTPNAQCVQVLGQARPKGGARDARDDEHVRKIARGEGVFALLTERFDESLVLLGARLGWARHDLVYAKQNVNKKSLRVARHQEQAASVADATRAADDASVLAARRAELEGSALSCDYALYDAAAQAHTARARDYDGARGGEGALAREVAQLRAASERIGKWCGSASKKGRRRALRRRLQAEPDGDEASWGSLCVQLAIDSNAAWPERASHHQHQGIAVAECSAFDSAVYSNSPG